MPKKKRTKKISNGTARGSRKVSLDNLQKVLMGKGAIDSFRPMGVSESEWSRKRRAV